MSQYGLHRAILIVISLLLSAVSVASAHAQIAEFTTLASQQGVLSSPCARVFDASDRYQGAYSFELQVVPGSGELPILRLLNEPIPLGAPTAGCSDSLKLNGDGSAVEYLATNAVIDTNLASSYRIRAIASLSGASIDFQVAEAALNPDLLNIVFAASDSGSKDCSFGNVEDCRLFSISVAIERNGSGVVTSIQPDVSTFKELIPGVAAVMPDVSPDGTRVAFLHTSSDSDLAYRHSYVLDISSGTLLDITGGNNHSDQGDWPHWISDTEIMYSNINYCPDSDSPGCNFESRYSDVMLARLSTDRSAVIETDFLFGDVTTANFDSRFCDAGDSVFFPSSSGLVAFHSTTIDGETSVHDASCPWLDGLPGFNGEDYAGPKPVIWNLAAATAGSVISEKTAGEDYWLFDMESVGINSLAHLYFASNGMVLGTEQNTVSQPLRRCSLNSISLSQGLQACQDAGGTLLLYNRIFAFENTGSTYENVRRNENPRLPLFTHLHPAELPGSERYYDPLSVATNFQYKYAEFAGTHNTVIATVMNHDSNDTEVHFSRLMLIDIADPDAPMYFDLTGWLEDEFPDRWSSGSARGFTATSATQ